VRQHRHNAVWEIDRRPAQVGLLVEHSTLGNVVRHVRDVDGEAPAVAARLDADGVVMVARVSRVDRHRRPGAEIAAPDDLLGLDAGRDARRRVLDLLRERVGQVELGHDDLEVDAGILETSEDGGDAAVRVARRRWRTRDLGHDHLPRTRGSRRAHGNEDLVQDAPIEGHDVATDASFGLLVAADDARHVALEDADDASLEPFGRRALDARHDAVAVECFLKIDRRDVDVPAATSAWRTRGRVRHDEAVATRAAREPPDDQVHASRQPDARAADLDDRAVFDQPAQRRLQLAPRLALEVETLHELAYGNWFSSLREQVQDPPLEGIFHQRTERSPILSCTTRRRLTAACDRWCRRWDLNPH
jgi:hypothetical protein